MLERTPETLTRLVEPQRPDIEQPFAAKRGLLVELLHQGWLLFVRVSFASLTRRIIFLNVTGLLALVIGVLYLSQFRAGLIDARMQSLLVQGEIIAGAIATSATVETDTITIDPERHTCTWKNEPVTLTVTEFLILQALASRPGVVKSRNALMDAAYDDQVYVDDRTIDSHIKRLRKKFKGTDDDFDMIETLYGVGYRFKEM